MKRFRPLKFCQHAGLASNFPTFPFLSSHNLQTFWQLFCLLGIQVYRMRVSLTQIWMSPDVDASSSGEWLAPGVGVVCHILNGVPSVCLGLCLGVPIAYGLDFWGVLEDHGLKGKLLLVEVSVRPGVLGVGDLHLLATGVCSLRLCGVLELREMGVKFYNFTSSITFKFWGSLIFFTNFVQVTVNFL